MSLIGIGHHRMGNTSQFDKLKFSSRAEIGIKIMVTLSAIFRIHCEYIVCGRVNHSTWPKSTPNSKSLATFSLAIACIGT